MICRVASDVCTSVGRLLLYILAAFTERNNKDIIIVQIVSDIVMKITCNIMVLIARATTDRNNIFHQIDFNLVCVP